MRHNYFTIPCLLAALVAFSHPCAAAGAGVQIPTIQLCNDFKVRILTLDQAVLVQTGNLVAGGGAAGRPPGTFEMAINVACRPGSFPNGTVSIGTFSGMTTSPNGISSVDITGVNAILGPGGVGWVTARCKTKDGQLCYLWVMVADNDPSLPALVAKTPTEDLVTVTVLDERGNAIFYGSGVVKKGFVVVKAD